MQKLSSMDPMDPIGQIKSGRRTQRSKRGCETCRSRRVKCDEVRPKCTKCTRLRLGCEWSRGDVPLRVRRRGYGCLKSRDESWAPKTILPAQPEINPIVGSQSLTETNPSSKLSSKQKSIDSPLASDAWWPTSDNVDEILLWPTSADGELSLDFDRLPSIMSGSDPFQLGGSALASSLHSDVQDLPPMLPCAWSDHSTSLLNDFQSAEQALGAMLPYALSDSHISLPNSLTLSNSGHNALKHYQTTFALYRSTKEPFWSTHRILLNLGAHNSMVMHLLLAVSFNDVGSNKNLGSASDEAQYHFQAGAQMLIENIQTDKEPDCVALMAAFFFLYLYMSKRESIVPHRLRQLSLATLDFVKRHDLVARCIVSPDSQRAESINTMAPGSSLRRSMLARLLMWTFDEDVRCGFQESGGYFARYLTLHSIAVKDVYEVSRNALGSHWGVEYPNSQILDDDQNSTVLEFLWAMISLWQEINDLAQESDATSSKSDHRIEGSFFALEEKYVSVFQLASETTEPRPRVFINAAYDVVLFNALKVYYFRTTIKDLKMETPRHIQIALKTLITVVQRDFARQSTVLHAKLQWPLFLAGIETDDSIYREWILSRLTSDHVAAALQRALDAQRLAGQRLLMADIRKLIFVADNLDLASSGEGFLNAI